MENTLGLPSTLGVLSTPKLLKAIQPNINVVVCMEWFHTAIPRVLAEQIKKSNLEASFPVHLHSLLPSWLDLKIQAALGYPTTGAFIQEAVRRHIVKEQRRFDEIEQEREVGRKALGKDDSGEL